LLSLSKPTSSKDKEALPMSLKRRKIQKTTPAMESMELWSLWLSPEEFLLIENHTKFDDVD
jgi:hypothetical protein